jgi:glycogen(starch) synthase
MNILITSRLFLPHLGGSIDSCCFLAKGLQDLGHQVKITTRTPAGMAAAEADRDWPELIRCPSMRQQFELAQWCDVALQIELSIKDALPLLIMRKPIVPTIHTNMHACDGQRTPLQILIKRELLKFFPTIAVSRFVARDWDLDAEPIITTYDDTVFHLPDPAVPRTNDIIFLGRHVSEKGVHILIEALLLLKNRGIRPKTTILGDGPLRKELEDTVGKADMNSWIHFAGRLETKDMVELMHRTRIQVVPSVWEEPLGLVVMQGMACGCRVIASNCGGIPEAGGHVAIYCHPDNAEDLADKIESTLALPAELTTDEREELDAHLAAFTRQRFSQNYEEFLKSVLNRTGQPR